MGLPATRDDDKGSMSRKTHVDLIIFRVASLVCALDIARAQEIKGQLAIVEVPEAAVNVRGVANLRGQVITVIDLRVVLGIEPQPIDRDSRIVVVRTDTSVVGLLVDYVDDIVTAEREFLQPPPANVSGIRGEFFESVYRRDADLACILSLDRILRDH